MGWTKDRQGPVGPQPELGMSESGGLAGWTRACEGSVGPEDGPGMDSLWRVEGGWLPKKLCNLLIYKDMNTVKSDITTYRERGMPSGAIAVRQQ